MLGMDLKDGDVGEIALNLLRRSERKEATLIDFGGCHAFTASSFHQLKIDWSRRVVVMDHVREAGNTKPIGCENLWRFLHPDRHSLSVVLPIRIDCGPVWS